MRRTIFGLVLSLLAGRTVGAADLTLPINEDLNPIVSGDYPFVYPFTGTMGIGDWRMVCSAAVCGGGETNFGSTEHAVPDLHHTGEDWLIEANSGLTEDVAVRAINHGVVVYAGVHNVQTEKTGYLVIIKHVAPDDQPFVLPAYPYRSCGRFMEEGRIVYSYYLHLSRELMVHEGEQVFKGQIIGSTYTLDDVFPNPSCKRAKGNSSAPFAYCPHLHFEIWDKIRVSGADQNNDSNGYDDQGCGGLGTFGYSLGKLLRPEIFIEENNAGSMIGAVKQAGDDLIIHGAEFGSGGSVEVRSCNNEYTFAPMAGDWHDTEIVLRSTLLASTSGEPLKDINLPLSIRILPTGRKPSNAKYFPFTDVACEWYSGPVIKLFDLGIISGKEKVMCSDALAGGCSFAPEGNATRVELLAMLVRARSAECTPSQPCSQGIPYQDVAASDWYYDIVRAAYHRGWIEMSDMFRPEENVNRAETAKLLSRAFQIPADGLGCGDFTDVKNPAEWFYEPVCSMSRHGVVTGYRAGYRCDGSAADLSSERYFCPQRPISRAEAAAMIGKSLDIGHVREGSN